jgi:hypothetical protein
LHRLRDVLHAAIAKGARGVNCWLVPSASEGMAGVTAMETTAAGDTVKTVVPEIEPDVAVIVVVPVARLVASPWLPEVLLMLATAGLDEVQVAVVVRFWVEPSL